MKNMESLHLGSLLGCRKNRLVYLNVPKSACTTIKNLMYYLDNGHYLEYPLAIHKKKAGLLRFDTRPNQFIRKLLKGYFLFTFVRQPYKRVYSCFIDKIHNVDAHSFPQIRQYLVENYGLRFESGEKLDLDLHRENFRNFLRFVRDNEAGKTDIKKNYHWAPQSDIIRHHTKHVQLSYVGIVEDFANHFREVMKLAGVTKQLAEIPKFNESAPSSVSLDQIKDAGISRLLGEIYENDLALYEKHRKKQHLASNMHDGSEDSTAKVGQSLTTSALAAPQKVQQDAAASALRLGNMHACRTNRLVYLNVPKSACTTIRNIMYFLDKGQFPKDPLGIHWDANALLTGSNSRDELIRALVRNRFAFTFVRDPSKRIYSCYMDKIHRTGQHSFPQVRDYIITQYNLDSAEFDPETDIERHRENFTRFLKFVSENLRGLTGIHKDYHWQLQKNIIDYHSRDVPMDFIGIVEKFKPHFDYVLKQAGVNIEVPTSSKFNEASGDKVPFSRVVTPGIQELINDIFASDMKLYEDVQKRTADVAT